jgi:hypothetical protein
MHAKLLNDFICSRIKSIDIPSNVLTRQLPPEIKIELRLPIVLISGILTVNIEMRLLRPIRAQV